MDTALLRKQADMLDDLRGRRDQIVASRNAVLAVQCGQKTAVMGIAGVSFSITSLNNCYMPEVVKGMEIIQKECAKLLQCQIDTLDSKIRGAENSMRGLMKSKGGAQ